MCKYCEKGEPICKQNRDVLGLELHLGSRYLVVYGIDKKGNDISVNCKIKYCPMCGKKLKIFN